MCPTVVKASRRGAQGVRGARGQLRLDVSIEHIRACHDRTRTRGNQSTIARRFKRRLRPAHLVAASLSHRRPACRHRLVRCEPTTANDLRRGRTGGALSVRLSPGLPGCQQRLPAGCQLVARLPGCQVARLPGCQWLPAVASGCQQRLPVTTCTYWQPRLPAGCQVASRVARLPAVASVNN